MTELPPRGRSSGSDIPNRFEKLALVIDPSAPDSEGSLQVSTEWFVDASRSIVSENNSPDIPFRYSVNPYRGCEHGCAYCYARPTHEYLGWNAGLDFESKILVKLNAAELLREWLLRPAWTGERISMSGVTDPYQPIERQLKIVRSLLEVARDFRQAMSVITKNALVERDTELLADLAQEKLTSVAISITSLDPVLSRAMEPRCSSPSARLRAIETLSRAGVQVFASLAPIIPGLNDSEIPSILSAVKEAGAIGAGMSLLRLPGAVEPIFLQWLDQKLPHAKDRVLSRIRSTRKGELHQSNFGERMRGDGPIALQIRQTFEVFRMKYQLDAKGATIDTSKFYRPTLSNGQRMLF